MNEWKKILFYAIVPALIAGVFAVAPKLYDEFTEPKAVLSYLITKGPVLTEGNIRKTIFAINISNDGRKPLTNITSLLNTESDIQALTTYEETGLKPSVNKTNTPYTISVATLHPDESFVISLMLVSSKDSPEINFQLRSKETLGVAKNPNISKKSQSTDILSAFMAGFSVFIMSFVLLFRGKRGLPLPLLMNKPHVLYYLSARLGFVDIIERYGLSEGHTTYLRFGDMLLAKGQSGSDEEKQKAITGLKCLLLIEHMASSSKKLIIRNIKVLEGSDYSQEEIDLIISKAGKMSDHEGLRDLFDEYISAPTVFLT
jgi:hypothetical protein